MDCNYKTYKISKTDVFPSLLKAMTNFYIYTFLVSRKNLTVNHRMSFELLWISEALIIFPLS